MKKIKIIITVFSVYELLLLTILQVPRFCRYFLGLNFCASGGFKYFVINIMIPILLGLIVWWWPKNKCQCECNNQQNNKQDIEQLIISEIIAELKKTIFNSVKIKKFVNSWLGKISGDSGK